MACDYDLDPGGSKNQAGSFPDEPASEAMTVNKKKCVSSSNNKKCKKDKHGNEDCEEDD
jgi:hypothetical protein